jgi:hypothetical protein
LERVPADGEESDKREGAAQLPVMVALILFVEAPLDLQADIDTATELHRHSIRLSQLNSQQRLEMVHQLAQALALYYEGGIRPEEVARLALAAGQVGALIGIAANE